ncbi:MAG TPA: CoA pyrophosphatase [Xanthobacteraceae bacterium]|nr:CoA pyrophosphatase [Xanthobacteraceae bacterium]
MTVPRIADTTSDFFSLARARLTLDVPAGLTDASITPARGDHDLDPMAAAIAALRPIRLAAVLVPVVARAEPMVLLTQRSAHLKEHAGQISFPGGKIDPGDASPMAAALREADEEIGLAADRIEPIGYLDLYLTTFGFRIVPLVARVAPEFVLTLNPGEVDDAFEVPLAFLMSPENHQRKSRDWNGLTRHFYEMPFGDRYIWGATAGILRSLYERIYAI